MAEQLDLATRDYQQDPIQVRPTLFIGVGGTGMEISLRVRRRLLNHIWGEADTPVRLSSLTDFPLAQFINFDLDSITTTESGRATATDPLAKMVKFTDAEKLISPLDLDQYLSSDSALNTFEHIASWFPLTRRKVQSLGIDPSQGAGQIRALSRLYFFDKYQQIKTKIEDKVRDLLAGVSSKDKTERLGLKLEDASLRVVVIASTAGGTGSGSFLDMGYMAKWLARQQCLKSKVDLCMMLPSGYAGSGKARTEANSYAALMELESCMRHGLQYVRQWSANETPQLSVTPYDDVYFFDTGNVALKKTNNASDLFDMVADILFEDFTSAEFSSRKRSIAVNQSQYKIDSYSPPVDSKKYGNMRLLYSKAYSAFGQSIIDTQLEQRRDEIVCSQVNAMLKVFFGLATDNDEGVQVPPPSPDDGRKLLRDHVQCERQVFTLAYAFSCDAVPYGKGTEFNILKLTEDLLFDGDKHLLGSQHDKINKTIDEIIASSEKDQRLTSVNDFLSQLDRDLGIEGNATDMGAKGLEEAIKARRQLLFAHFKDEKSSILKALWNAVDDKEKGGLDYTVKLVERVKDAIENDATGLLRDLGIAEQWFRGLCAKLRGEEMQVLRDHIAQAKGGGIFGFGKDTKIAQADAKLQQLGEAVRWYTEARLRELACREAAVLLHDLSAWLGVHQGIDSKNNRKMWTSNSYVGKLAGYEKLIIAIMAEINDEVVRTREASKQGHASYQIIKVATSDLDKARKLDSQMAMEWAKSVFSNMGGSREIFQKLEDEETRGGLIGQLRNLALSRLPLSESGEENSLIKALSDMTPAERRPIFQSCLDMAMPWVEANLGGIWKVKPDQYACVIGIRGAKIFEKEFGDEFKAVIPSITQLSQKKIQFYETGVSGKLTCYVELSGIPITSFNMLSNWRVNYNEEGKTIPVHTHKDKTLFVHPMAPNTNDLERLAESFNLYIKGISLGVLKVRKDESERFYCLNLYGESLSIGNERTIRLEGVAPEYIAPLKEKIKVARDKITTPIQQAALVVLDQFFAEKVYPPAKITNENHVEMLADGFSRVLCLKMQEEELQKLAKKTLIQKIDVDELITRMRGDEYGNLDLWTDEIDGSEDDVYPSEVGAAHGPKRVLKPEVFVEGWLEKVVGYPPALDQVIIPIPSGNKSPQACQKCDYNISGTPKFCPECGSSDWKKVELSKVCPFCSAAVAGNPKFCPECGKPMPAPAVPKCSDCGATIAGNPKFCSDCGNSFGAPRKCCPNPDCGVAIEGDLRFCPECGKPL